MCRIYFIIVVLVAAASTKGQDDELTWWNIGMSLREFMNTGLGADKLQDYIRTNFDWQPSTVNEAERIQQMSGQVFKLFDDIIKGVREMKSTIEHAYDTWEPTPLAQVNESRMCCQAKQQNEDGCAVSPSRGPQREQYLALSPPEYVVQEMKNLKHSGLVHYFAFTDGSLYMYPAISPVTVRDPLVCNSYDPRLRYFYTGSKSPEPRVVVVVVDATPTNNSLLVQLINRTFDALSQMDQVGLCLPGRNNTCLTEPEKENSGWPQQDLPLGHEPFLGRVVTRSDRHKNQLKKLLDKWITEHRTNHHQDVFSSHAAALSAGMKVFNTTNRHPFILSPEEPHKVMVYVTTRPGWKTWEEDQELNSTIDQAVNTNVSLVINPISGGAEDLEKPTILRDENNITVKLVPFPNEDMFKHSNTSVTSFGETSTDRPVIPIPYWDAFGSGYILTVCLPLVSGGQFVGTVCTDDTIVSLLGLTSVDDIPKAYVFLINSLGNTLMHPLLPLPHSLKEDPPSVSIDRLEHKILLDPIRASNGSGHQDVRGVQVVSVGRPRGTDLPSAVRRHWTDYRLYWAPIETTDLTIALVMPIKNNKVWSSAYKCYNQTSCRAPNFHYHRPTFQAAKRKTCKFFGTLKVMKDEGLVKLAPTCFIDVLGYLKNEDNATVTKLNSIFTNSAPYDELLKNDFRVGVRLVEEAEALWKQTKGLNDYIGSKYIGTEDGVFLSFPGTELKQEYDHRRRPWYQMSVSVREEGSISLTVPYCDEFGAGMVYTLARSLTTPEGDPLVVIAGDFTLQFIITFINKQVTACTKHTCFLVDELGYVVLKSDWTLEDTVPRNCADNTNITAAHINKLAPDLAQKMITSRLLRRRGCHDYERGLTFYYWWLGMTGQRTLHTGENYDVYKIPFTNLFLVVRTKSKTVADCRCHNNKGDEMLTCDDTCSKKCECPCVAGPNTHSCHQPKQDVHYRTKWSLPACKPRAPTLIIANKYTEEELSMETPCYSRKCNFTSQAECNSLVLCLWQNGQCKNVDNL